MKRKIDNLEGKREPSEPEVRSRKRTMRVRKGYGEKMRYSSWRKEKSDKKKKGWKLRHKPVPLQIKSHPTQEPPDNKLAMSQQK